MCENSSFEKKPILNEGGLTIKGKSAIGIARNLMGRSRNFTGENFCARGYFVSTVSLDEDVVRQYIREQEQEDERLEQLNLAYSATQPPSGGS